MTDDVSPDHGTGMAPLDDTVDHVRGGPAGRLIVEDGDYECPYGLLFHRQRALGEDDLRGYAADSGSTFGRFDTDRASAGVIARIRRDVESGLATGEILGTPTMFIGDVVHRGSYDAASLLQEVTVP